MKKYLIIMITVIATMLSLNGVLLAATTAPVVVSATVAATDRSITASPTPISWSLPAGSATVHRFTSPIVTVDFYGGNLAGGYKIRAYTQNTSADDVRGYLVKATDRLYLKIWCANFGPGYAKINPLTPPSANNNYFWGGYDFNGDGDKTDWGKNGTLAAGVKYTEATLGFDINGDGDTADIIEVAGSTADPDTFVYNGTTAKYWLGESPSFSWIANQPTLTSYELKLSDDVNSLDSGFKVAFAVDVDGVVGGIYTAAGTGVMFDIVAK